MRPAPALLLVLATLACKEGKIELELNEDGIADDETDGSGSTGGAPGTGTDGDPGDDEPGDSDPGDDDPAPEGSRWAGAYLGEQSLGFITGNGEWRDLCYGEADWDISEDGVLSGRGECVIERGPAAGEALWFEYEGDTGADGYATGQATLSADWRDAVDVLDFEGVLVDEGGETWMEGWVTGTIQTRDGDAPVEGWAWGARW